MIVVEGGVRDADEIIELGFPIFPGHVVPLPGKTYAFPMSVRLKWRGKAVKSTIGITL